MPEVKITINALDKTKKAFISTQKNVNTMKTRFTGAFKKMKLSMSSFAIGVKTKLVGSIKSLLSSGIAPLIAMMGVAGLGMAIKGTIDAFSKFEQSAANAASVTGVFGDAFIEVKKHIMAVSKELGETTVFKASEAADAFYDLASAGYDVAKMGIDELKPVLDLAAATQAELKKTTEIVTASLGQFGLTMQDSIRIADVFAKTIGSSKATIDKLGVSMATVGPVANAMGLEIEETSAILGILYNSGIDASTAGTALRGAFARLMSPTSAMVGVLKDLGVTLEEVNPETKSLADILDLLSSKGLSSGQAMEFFGLRAGPAMLALTENTDDIRTLTSELYAAGGVAERMAEQQLTTFEGQMKLVSSQIEATSIKLGKSLAPSLLMVSNFIVEDLIPSLESLGQSFWKQLDGAIVPFTNALDEAFVKLTKGVEPMDTLTDTTIIMGEAFETLLNGITWLVDALGPLWDALNIIVVLLTDGIHNLALAMQTEEEAAETLKDATEDLTLAKLSLYQANEMLKKALGNVVQILKDENMWTESLNELEERAIINEENLTKARQEAAKAMELYDEGSEELNLALENVQRLEKLSVESTKEYEKALDGQIIKLKDSGIASDKLLGAYYRQGKAVDKVIERTEDMGEVLSDVNKKEADLTLQSKGFWSSMVGSVRDSIDKVKHFVGISKVSVESLEISADNTKKVFLEVGDTVESVQEQIIDSTEEVEEAFINEKDALELLEKATSDLIVMKGNLLNAQMGQKKSTDILWEAIKPTASKELLKAEEDLKIAEEKLSEKREKAIKIMNKYGIDSWVTKNAIEEVRDAEEDVIKAVEDFEKMLLKQTELLMDNALAIDAVRDAYYDLIKAMNAAEERAKTLDLGVTSVEQVTDLLDESKDIEKGEVTEDQYILETKKILEKEATKEQTVPTLSEIKKSLQIEIPVKTFIESEKEFGEMGTKAGETFASKFGEKLKKDVLISAEFMNDYFLSLVPKIKKEMETCGVTGLMGLGLHEILTDLYDRMYLFGFTKDLTSYQTGGFVSKMGIVEPGEYVIPAHVTKEIITGKREDININVNFGGTVPSGLDLYELKNLIRNELLLAVKRVK